MSSKEMLNNSNEPETPNDKSAPRSSHCSTSLADAIETVELWVDMWADEQAEIEEVSPCDIEERNVIAAVHVVLNAIKSKGAVPKNLMVCKQLPWMCGECGTEGVRSLRLADNGDLVATCDQCGTEWV